MTDIAASWLRGLAARGISTHLVNGRIQVSAYKTLTDDEILTLRHHREEIKDAITRTAPTHFAAGTSDMTPEEMKVALATIEQALEQRIEVWRTVIAADGHEVRRIYRGSVYTERSEPQQ